MNQPEQPIPHIEDSILESVAPAGGAPFYVNFTETRHVSPPIEIHNAHDINNTYQSVSRIRSRYCK